MVMSHAARRTAATAVGRVDAEGLIADGSFAVLRRLRMTGRHPITIAIDIASHDALRRTSTISGIPMIDAACVVMKRITAAPANIAYESRVREPRMAMIAAIANMAMRNGVSIMYAVSFGASAPANVRKNGK